LAKSLVIVESPAKARTIERLLGRGYEVAASMGHVRDLPKSQLGVDIERGFTPQYITIRGKGEVIAALRERARKAQGVLLATDPDREGEAISWHLCQVLGLNPGDPRRITFHEVTREAVLRALGAPRPIDQRLVDAQQARRVLDRLVGYMLSPLLWRKVRSGLSAGRVQSVAVRLICDREAEIAAFRPEEYWTLQARLRHGGQTFVARYWGRGERRAELPDAASVRAVLHDLGLDPDRLEGDLASGVVLELPAEQVWPVVRVQRRERRRHPAPPFTTATLQQEAARKLGFTVRRTMRLAQELYEGLPVDGEHVGLITYMRTDSTRVAQQAVDEALRFIRERWGDAYSAPRKGAAPAGAQDAHEAIRPTSVVRTPEELEGRIGRDHWRLYRLIWERFVASQMAPAILDTVTAELAAPGGHRFRASGSTVRFPGFTVLYVEGRDPEPKRRGQEGEESEEDSERALPPLAEGDRPLVVGLEPARHFTEPPPRYTEAMLVRALEEKGIGRPSTYATIIETIEARGYVEREQRRFRPTQLGVLVTELLKQHFPAIVDVAFTAEMERDLDRIETGERAWRQVVEAFYGPFRERLQAAEAAIDRISLPVETTDETCPECGRPMVVRRGRFGPFLACSGYPDCKTTRAIVERTGVRCPKCGQGELVARRSRRGRTFYGCDRYPECDQVFWERPVGPCPDCGQPMVQRRRGGASWRQCTNPDCGRREAAEAGEAEGVAAAAAPAGESGPGGETDEAPAPRARARARSARHQA
jgi:DNA topoisomerase-1